jgi:hypothetical protein
MADSPTDSMNLYFAYSKTAIDSFLNAHYGNAQETAFVGLNWEAQEAIGSNQLKDLPVANLITYPLAEQIDAFVEKLSREWYLDEHGKDFTTFRHLSIGKLYQTELRYQRFHHIYKYAALIKRAIEKENPQIIWVDSSCPPLFYGLLQSCWTPEMNSFLLKRFGEEPVPKKRLFADIVGPTYVRRQDNASTNREWKSYLFWKGYNLLAYIIRTFRRGTESPYHVLLSYYPTLDSLFESSLEALQRQQFNVTLLERPGKAFIFRYLRSGVQILTPNTDGNFLKHRAPRTLNELSNVKKIRDQWARLRTSTMYQERFRFESLLPWDILTLSIEEEVINPLDSICHWINLLYDFFSTHPRGAIIMGSDSTPRHCGVVEVAKHFDWRSIHVMHGVPAFYDRMHGMFADYEAGGGNVIRNAYREQGKPDNRILTDYGCIFDRYAGSIKTVKSRTSTTPKVLVISHVYDGHSAHAMMSDPEEHVRHIAAAFSKLKGVQWTLKIHPGESLEYYKRVLDILHIDCPLYDKINIDQLLLSHDILVTPPSTVLLQAALLKKRIILVDFVRQPYVYPEPFREGWGFPFVSTSEQLKVALETELQCNEPPDYSRLIQHVAGVVDGHASRRLLQKVPSLFTA